MDTLYDLNKTATTAAESAFGKDALAVDSIKIESFASAGHDRLDYPRWESFFINAVANITALKNQPAPSATAAANKTAPASN